jgi:hypothetical protein
VLFAAIFGHRKESFLPLLPRFGFEKIDSIRTSLRSSRETRIIVGVDIIEGRCMR